MRSNHGLTTTFAFAAAALFMAGCGKTQPTTTPPGGTAAPAGSGADAGGDAAGEGEDEAAEVKCFGINACSGQSACDVAGSHDCGGQNSCKSKGWILVPQAECEHKGGKVI